MHFATGELIEILEQDGGRRGRIRVAGAITEVDLTLLPQAVVGDMLLTHAGVALSKVEPE
jgi:hydrogenase maturation factor